MRVDQAFPGATIKASDIAPERTWTIRGVRIETIGQGQDQDTKPVVYFNEEQRGFVLNKTNANNMAAIFQDAEMDNWTGRQITLFSTMVEFGGKMVEGIRVRAPAQAAPVQPQQPAQPEYQGQQPFSGGTAIPIPPALQGGQQAPHAQPVGDIPPFDDKQFTS